MQKELMVVACCHLQKKTIIANSLEANLLMLLFVFGAVSFDQSALVLTRDRNKRPRF